MCRPLHATAHGVPATLVEMNHEPNGDSRGFRRMSSTLGNRGYRPMALTLAVKRELPGEEAKETLRFI